MRPNIQFSKSATSVFDNMILLAVLCVFPFLLRAQQDSKTFGDSVFTANGLAGNIYLLPVNTLRLPDFDSLQSSGTIYIDSVNIAPRSWSAGFPGLRNRFEWFGIQYAGFFQPAKAGEYTFRLLSDDGSKLFVDDSLIINNDGLHGAFSKSGRITLDETPHRIKIQYFQGPRYQLALQLFVGTNGSKQEIFPGSYFTLYTKRPQSTDRRYLLLFGGLVLLVILIAIVRNKKGKKSKDFSTTA
jgi:hypothetical protein